MRQVTCPRCGKRIAFSPKNEWRPFCSERCKMIDLGKWAAEDYRVPVEEDPKDPLSDPDSKPPES